MILYFIFAGIILIILVVLVIEFSFLVPSRKGLAILMYHKVSQTGEDGLTLSAGKLEKHFEFIRSKAYSLLTFSDLEALHRNKEKLPRRSLIITFDDAYQSYAELALPLLEKYKLKATVFIPVAYIAKTNIWDQGNDPIMTAETLGKIVSSGITEAGIHSFLHKSFSQLSPDDIKEDLENCYATLRFHKIPYVNVLAYPYGAFPRKDREQKEQMKALFDQLGLSFALRIGNRINKWPLRDPYEVKRIDIRGTDNFFTFKTKLRKGRRKLFS